VHSKAKARGNLGNGILVERKYARAITRGSL
jgi:hypothetical protein